MVNELRTPQEAIRWIRDKSWSGSKLGLTRASELLERVGSPQDALTFIHIAGTNGKGSVAAMLSGVLLASGRKTGLFTSPYLKSFNEQMRTDGISISDSELVAAANAVRFAAEEMADHPTEFELITAIAMLWFAQKGCDVVVLETGLGGRLDATNVIPPPVLAVITSISMDHMSYLGDTIEAIASEKAGIIKEGSTVISAPQPEAAARVIEVKCNEIGIPFFFADPSKIKRIKQDMSGQSFTISHFRSATASASAPASTPVSASASASAPPPRPFYIPLIGTHQLVNASVALECVCALNQKGWDISDTAVRSGLADARWPGRMELLQTEPVPVFIDGAHNVAGVQSAVDTLLELFPDDELRDNEPLKFGAVPKRFKRFNFVFGVLKDKEWREMYLIIARVAKSIQLVTPSSDRALPARELAALIGMPPQSESLTMEEGLADTIADSRRGDVVCVLGSLYLQK